MESSNEKWEGDSVTIDTLLETERLILRKFSLDDFFEYYHVMKEPQVGRWLRGVDDGAGFTKEETRQWIQGFINSWDQYGYGPFAVVEGNTNKLIGHCGIRFNPNYDWTEFMYGIHPEHWGKGYATEAAKRCLDLGFIDLGLDRIYDYTLPDNLRAINVMKKLGMKYVKNFNHKGFDQVLYEIVSPHRR